MADNNTETTTQQEALMYKISTCYIFCSELTAEQEERYKLMRIIGEECIKENELRNLIKSKKDQIRCYDGFEPSGRMHIAQGVMKAINVNRLTKAGCRFIFLVADWYVFFLIFLHQGLHS